MKRSLLILQGIVYGDLTMPYPDLLKIMDNLPGGIVAAASVPWRNDTPYLAAPANFNLYGPMTDHAPIDMISWAAGPGVIGPTGMEIWEQCMTLFMRHI
jgi:hypothetical protein